MFDHQSFLKGTAMIVQVEVNSYRCLRDIRASLHPFQVLIGPNASGKSTFLDVVEFLADVTRDREGVATAVADRAPDIRDLCWMRQGNSFEMAVEALVPEVLQQLYSDSPYPRVRYEMQVGLHPQTGELCLLAETFFLKHENLSLVSRNTPVVQPPVRKRYPDGWRPVIKKILDSANDHFRAETSGWTNSFRLGLRRSALANLPEDEEKFPAAVWFRRLLLEGVQRLSLNSAMLRRPSPPGSSRQFLPDGSNLPWVVRDLEDHEPGRLREWIAHLRTALPDLHNIRTVERPEDRHCYLVLDYANGLQAPSWLVSDGTLRMLALTILAYIPDLEGIYLIEEPENGIHPRALETVLQSLSSVYNAQVLLATHSPLVLGLTRPENILCFTRTETGETTITRGSEHPLLEGWQHATDLGTLFASGVLG